MIPYRLNTHLLRAFDVFDKVIHKQRFGGFNL